MHQEFFGLLFAGEVAEHQIVKVFGDGVFEDCRKVLALP
jgi:hypothetical protein